MKAFKKGSRVVGFGPHGREVLVGEARCRNTTVGGCFPYSPSEMRKASAWVVAEDERSGEALQS